MRAPIKPPEPIEPVTKKLGIETYTTKARVVDRLENTAYDTVRFVGENMEDVFKSAMILDYVTSLLFYRFKATSNQTRFSGVDINGRELIPQAEPLVYLNWLEAHPSLYTVNPGSGEITFNIPLNEGDEVLVSSFGLSADGQVIFDLQLDMFQSLTDLVLLAQQQADAALSGSVTAKAASEAARDISIQAAENAQTKAELANQAATAAAGFASSAEVASTDAGNSSVSAAGSAILAGAALTDSQAALAGAQNAATAASTSAESAAASATTAGSEAAAAENSKLAAAASGGLADSARSGAEIARDAAVLAQQSAEAASSVATESRTLAAISAAYAGDSATAATQAATTAVTQATNASQSALLAEENKTQAETARAAAETSVASIAGSVTSAEAAAANAGSSATLAADSAALAGGSATAAAAAASEATTKATEAGASAAASETSASNAATSATAAGDSATASAMSATAAATSASDAGTSASASETSKLAAETASAAAAISQTQAATAASSAEGSAAAASWSSTLAVSAITANGKNYAAGWNDTLNWIWTQVDPGTFQLKTRAVDDPTCPGSEFLEGAFTGIPGDDYGTVEFDFKPLFGGFKEKFDGRKFRLTYDINVSGGTRALFGYTFRENDGNGDFYYPNDYIDDPAIAAGWVSRELIFDVPAGVGFLKGIYLRLYTTEGVQTFTRITNVVLEDITEAAAAVTRLDSVEADIDGFSTAFTGVTAEVAGGFISGFKATSWSDPDGSGGAVTEVLGDVIAPGSLATSKLTVGLGGNSFVNSDFFAPLSPNWRTRYQEAPGGTATALSIRPAGSSWTWPTKPVLQLWQNTGDTTGVTDIDCRPTVNTAGTLFAGWPAVAGEKISFSIRASAHRCVGQIFIDWYDASGTRLGITALTGHPLNLNTYTGVVSNDSNQSSSTNPSEWPLLWMISEAPPGAAYYIPCIRKGPTKAGETNSYLFVAEPMHCKTHAEASEPSPYVSSISTVIDGGQIRTGSLRVTSADIEDTIQSTNFVAGVSGWRIQKTGASEFNSIAIRRDLIVDGAVSDNTNQWDGTSTTINYFDLNWRNSHSTYINPNGRIVLVRGRIAFVNRDEGNTSDMRVELLRNGSLIASATFTQRSSVNYTTLEVSAIGADAGTYLMRYRVTSGNAGAIVKDKSLITQVVRR